MQKEGEMIIDSLGNLPPPQALDAGLEKNLETEEPRAIEDSEKGNDSTLDNNNQNIENNQVDKDIIKGGDTKRNTYNAQGNIAKELSYGNYTNHQQEIIDVLG